MAIPGDKRVQEKEKKGRPLHRPENWVAKNMALEISITPVVIGALETVSKDHKNFLIKINMAHKEKQIQKCAAFGKHTFSAVSWRRESTKVTSPWDPVASWWNNETSPGLPVKKNKKTTNGNSGH